MSSAGAPKYEQIMRHFEKRIFDGSLAEGTRLGSTIELAKQFEVNPETVQLALSRLVDRGLIERRRRTGTFVRGGLKGRSIGIVFGEGIFSEPSLAFFSVYMKRLSARLEEAGWNYKLFIMGDEPESDAAFNELLTAIEQGSLRAVIGFCLNAFVDEWLERRCPAPCLSPIMTVDYCDFVEKGLNYLFSLGRKSPVLFCGARLEPKEAASVELQAAKTLRASRLPGASVKTVFCGSMEADGYAAAVKIIDEGEAFDSALVLYDSVFRGVLYAFLERGLKIPSDVALITHANKGVNLFCHLPLTKLELDPDAFAKATVESLGMKIDGRAESPASLKATLVKGRSCGE